MYIKIIEAEGSYWYKDMVGQLLEAEQGDTKNDIYKVINFTEWQKKNIYKFDQKRLESKGYGILGRHIKIIPVFEYLMRKAIMEKRDEELRLLLYRLRGGNYYDRKSNT